MQGFLISDVVGEHNVVLKKKKKGIVDVAAYNKTLNRLNALFQDI